MCSKEMAQTIEKAPTSQWGTPGTEKTKLTEKPRVKSGTQSKNQRKKKKQNERKRKEEKRKKNIVRTAGARLKKCRLERNDY